MDLITKCMLLLVHVSAIQGIAEVGGREAVMDTLDRERQPCGSHEVL